MHNSKSRQHYDSRYVKRGIYIGGGVALRK